MQRAWIVPRRAPHGCDTGREGWGVAWAEGERPRAQGGTTRGGAKVSDSERWWRAAVLPPGVGSRRTKSPGWAVGVSEQPLPSSCTRSGVDGLAARVVPCRSPVRLRDLLEPQASRQGDPGIGTHASRVGCRDVVRGRCRRSGDNSPDLQSFVDAAAPRWSDRRRRRGGRSRSPRGWRSRRWSWHFSRRDAVPCCAPGGARYAGSRTSRC